MLVLIYRSTVATLLLAVILCGAYPLIVTGLGKVIFPSQANGSMITLGDGRVVGSRLIGQVFTRPEYFHGRPSAAGTGYDAANSSGSNLGPTNQKFVDGLKTNIDSVLKDNPTLKKGEVPVDLVTASGSGLDPHISPEGAWVQVSRVANARGIAAAEVKSLVDKHLEGPQWGIFGEPVVNVLLVNLDLDSLYPVHH
jgi:K+-transporting ATPase ATPase C chain